MRRRKRVPEHRQGQRGPRVDGRAIADAALRGAHDILTRKKIKVRPEQPEIPEGKKIVGGMIVPDFSTRKPEGARLKDRHGRTDADVQRSKRRREHNAVRSRRRQLRPKRKHGRQVRVR